MPNRSSPATLPPRDAMLSKGSRIQSSLNCNICHHAPFYKESDISSSMHWPRIDLGRTKETGFNNYASQNDLSREVTTAASA